MGKAQVVDGWVSTPIGEPLKLAKGVSFACEKSEFVKTGKVYFTIAKRVGESNTPVKALSMPMEEAEAFFAWLKMPKTLTITGTAKAAPAKPGKSAEFSPFKG